MRAVCSIPGFLADLASNPTPFALLAWLASGFDSQLMLLLACVVVYKALWDRWLLLRLRGHGMGLRQVWATPLRDLALAALWCHALFARSVEWRGVRLHLASGSTLHSTRPPPAHEPAADPRRVLP
jgi:hypothetical protein